MRTFDKEFDERYEEQRERAECLKHEEALHTDLELAMECFGVPELIEQLETISSKLRLYGHELSPRELCEYTLRELL